MENELNNLKITMSELKKDIGYIKESLDKNDSQHKEILEKIDHLGDTFQDKIQDKADQKEVMEKFNHMELRFVTQDSFRPIQKLAYGLTGAILLAVVGAILALIFKIT